MSNIIIYKGSYQYNAVNIFGEQLASGFEKLGKEVSFIDLTDSENLNKNLQKELSGNIECIVSFAGVGCNLKSNDQYIYDLLNIPFFAFLVDNPAHYLDRFKMKNVIISCYARSHVDFLNRYFKGEKTVEFLPHAGCIADLNDESQEEPGDIIFAGSFLDPDITYQKIKELDEFPKKLIMLIVELAMEGDSVPVSHAFYKAAEMAGIDLDNKNTFRQLAEFVLYRAEVMVRALKRMETLKMLDDNDISLSIYGNGWPDGIFNNHKLNGPRSFREILCLMKKAKLVLNMIMVPGSHERVFSAMLNGTAVLSDSNSFFNDFLKDGENILLYNYSKLDKLPEIVHNALNNPERLQAIAEAGQREALEKHTWDKRAELILEILNKQKKGIS